MTRDWTQRSLETVDQLDRVVLDQAAHGRAERAKGLASRSPSTDPDAIPLWILALLLTGLGVGLGNTGSIGILLEAVRPERVVTAMIVWSQIGITGYLVGPVAADAVADRLGFAALGLVPLGAALLLLWTTGWQAQKPDARRRGPATCAARRSCRRETICSIGTLKIRASSSLRHDRSCWKTGSGRSLARTERSARPGR